MSGIKYTIIRSRRRTMAIEITPEAQVLARVPLMMTDGAVNEFIEARKGWIEKHLDKIRKKNAEKNSEPKLTETERKELIDKALKIIPERVEYYAGKIGVTYGNITIRNQKTRWGSCSTKGNLNFHYMLAAMPDEVLDYVVVHELCHRREMNHSPKFWAEVAKILPDHKTVRKWLKDNGSAYLAKDR
ncbi:MAG: M48 family metallopeptidase [Lachnospiraceae bacterium]|nr:M48 family metallopeptidase [Lachnospiraceae bacterium]